jgi:hypothetical protein
VQQSGEEPQLGIGLKALGVALQSGGDHPRRVTLVVVGDLVFEQVAGFVAGGQGHGEKGCGLRG